MQTVLIVIHIMVVIALVATVLLQRSEGGAFLGTGGGFMTGRGQANVLTRTTAILAAMFFVTSLALTILANWEQGSKSIFEGAAPPAGTSAPAAPKPQGSLVDQLKKLQQERQGSASVPGAPTLPQAPRSQ